MHEEVVNTEPLLELVYWKMRGTAQPIRNILEYLRLPYKETYADPPKVFDVKYIHTALHTLPILIDGDFKITEVVPIVKYICKRAGRNDMLGKTPYEAAKVEQTLIRQIQLKNSLMMEVLPSNDLISPDPNIRQQFIQESFNDPMRKNYLEQVDATLSSNGWALGYLSILDFFFYEFSFVMNGFFPELLQRYRSLYVTFKQRFQQIQVMKEYFESDRLLKNMTLSKLSLKWRGNPQYS